MSPRAGIVVTDMSTPISAPDLVEVRERTPAVPASQAMKKEKKSGCEMKWVSGCGAWGPWGARSVHLNTSDHRIATATAAGKPTASAAKERRARSMRRETTATQVAATGPKSGPT